ncbi:SAF domain-containing protein, partial [Paenibacillus sp.]|uniref:SAF domain-containing protein n=1 Tax=Paenibacillus sp. TaxID=58172 RepID=UPI002D60A6A5
YNREVIRFKGCISNAAGDALLIYRPYHLCGVETAISLLVAGILGLHTGTDDYRPRYDMVKTTTREMKAGEVVGGDGDPSFKASLLPAGPIGDGLPIAAHLATGRKLTRDVPAGTLLTADLVELEGDSALLALRREQDAHFLVPK